MGENIKDVDIEKTKEILGENPDFGDSWWAPIALMAVLGFRGMEKSSNPEE